MDPEIPMNDPVQVATSANSLGRFLARLWHEDVGQDIVEYALVALAMGLTTVAGIHGLASSIINDLNFIVNGFAAATSGH
jgi:Flp pilus assembly pilin Flp